MYGHPPYRSEPFSFDELYYYVKHRTFAGFTRERPNAPTIILKALGRQEEISVGFSVLEYLKGAPAEGTFLVQGIQIDKTLAGTNKTVRVILKGLYTLDRQTYGMDDSRQNTGLIVSVSGIPYFSLELRQYAPGRALGIVPGPKNTCLVVECDALREEMNIGRSALTDSEIKRTFEAALVEGLQRIADSSEFKKFSKIPESRKFSKDADFLTERQKKLQSAEQVWVWLQSKDGRWSQLHRKPENETDTLAVLWKLETTDGGLPFAEFKTLEHSPSGADLICHIKEDKDDARRPFAIIEAKYLYYGIDKLGHHPGQMQHVICWDFGKDKREGIEQVGAKPWKFIQRQADQMVIVYVLSRMPRIKAATEHEIQRYP